MAQLLQAEQQQPSARHNQDQCLTDAAAGSVAEFDLEDIDAVLVDEVDDTVGGLDIDINV